MKGKKKMYKDSRYVDRECCCSGCSPAALSSPEFAQSAPLVSCMSEVGLLGPGPRPLYRAQQKRHQHLQSNFLQVRRLVLRLDWSVAGYHSSRRCLSSSAQRLHCLLTCAIACNHKQFAIAKAPPSPIAFCPTTEATIGSQRSTGASVTQEVAREVQNRSALQMYQASQAPVDRQSGCHPDGAPVSAVSVLSAHALTASRMPRPPR
jgi:hypothetical protein